MVHVQHFYETSMVRLFCHHYLIQCSLTQLPSLAFSLSQVFSFVEKTLVFLVDFWCFLAIFKMHRQSIDIILHNAMEHIFLAANDINSCLKQDT